MLAPVQKAVQLYNELSTLPYDQEDRIRAIGWQLRGLHRQRPIDADVGVAFLQAQAMAGEAAEAREIASALWHHRKSMSPVMAWNFTICLSDLGMYERSSEMLLIASTYESTAKLTTARALIATGLGDASFFAETADRLQADEAALFRRFAGHPDYLRARQAAVRQVVAPGQVGYTVEIVAKAELDVGIYVSGTFAERRLLEQRIDDAAARVAAEFGVPVDLLPIIETVHDHRAHPPKRHQCR